MVYFILMIFEYDPAKSLSNKEKHGIDFEEVTELWLDESLYKFQHERMMNNDSLLSAELAEKFGLA